MEGSTLLWSLWRSYYKTQLGERHGTCDTNTGRWSIHDLDQVPTDRMLAEPGSTGCEGDMLGLFTA